MNIKLQFLEMGIKSPVLVLLMLFSWLSITHQSAASSSFYFDPSLKPFAGSTVHTGNKDSGDFFQAVDVTITGIVRDQNQEPIPGVTVSLPGTGTGTATDMDGRYSITVPEGSTLVFSFIGFESHTVEVGTQT